MTRSAFLTFAVTAALVAAGSAACDTDAAVERSSSPPSSPSRAGASTTTTASSTTTVVPADDIERLVRLTPQCPGIGAAPPAGQAVVTWSRGDAVSSSERCLVATGIGASFLWSRAGDRLLVYHGPEAAMVLPDIGAVMLDVPGGTPSLSPDGRNVVTVWKGQVWTQTIGQPARRLDRVPDTTTVIHHPDGRQLVVVGEWNGLDGIMVTDAAMATRRSLVTDHGKIYDIAWTVNGDLLFTAQHSDEWHVHRLATGTGQLTTLRTLAHDQDGWLVSVRASPYDDGTYAVLHGACGTDIVGGGGASPPVPHEACDFIGWLPDGSLVGRSSSEPASPLNLVTPGTTVQLATHALNVRLRGLPQEP